MAIDYRKKELLVIDLGSYSIKALIGKASSKGFSVKKALTIPISSNIYTNGDFQNYMELSNIIKELVENYQLKNYPVVFTFSSTNSFARVLEVPAVSTTELKSVIEFEMQQYLPADVSAYSTQFRIFAGDQPKSEGSLRVLAGTIPKSVAENLWNIANECELEPLALDIHPNALIKVVTLASEINDSTNLTEQNIAFVELGHTLMDISIFEKGEFQFNRRILIGGKNVDQRIQRVLGITLDDARMEKHQSEDINLDVSDYTNESRVMNSVKTGVDEWISELEKVIKFYVSRKAGSKIDCCYLYGGGTGITGIDKYVTRMLDIPTETICKLGSLIDSTEMIQEETTRAVYSGETGIRHLDEYLNLGTGDDLSGSDEQTDLYEGVATGMKHLDSYLNTQAGGSNKNDNIDEHSLLSEDKIPLFINALGSLLRREEHKK